MASGATQERREGQVTQIVVIRDCRGAICQIEFAHDESRFKGNEPIDFHADYAVWPGWRLLMQDAGLAAPPILRRAELPGDLFARDQVRLNSLDFFKLWSAIEDEARSLDAALPAPLRIANVMTSDWFDPELFAALCSANLGSAIERMAKYMRLIAPMDVKVERAPMRATVTIDFLDQTKTPPAVFLAFKLVFFVQLGRLATRTAIKPLKVTWPGAADLPKADAALYGEFFGMPVVEAPMATLMFSTEDFDRPFLTENHKIWLFFEPALRQRLADLDRTASMVERVRSALLEALPAGEVSMNAIGKKLGVVHGPCSDGCRKRDPHSSKPSMLSGLRLQITICARQ